jgi:hypothetical protein
MLRLLLLLLAASMSGCTAIGYGIGAATDDLDLDAVADSARLASCAGRSAELELIDGPTLTGTIVGYGSVTPEEYVRALRRWRQRGVTISEAQELGDSVSAIGYRGDTIVVGAFGGFTGGGIIVGGASVALRELSSLRDAGGHELLPELLALSMLGRVPVATGLVIETDSGRVALDPRSIRVVDVDDDGVGRGLGTAVGLILDILAVRLNRELRRM